MLQVSHLTFSYRRGRSHQPILQDLSFTLERGRCLVVAGSNGCGKSTLLSVLSGGLPGAQGAIRTDGETIGLVPQGFAVFEDMSVLDNLRFFARLQRKPVTRPLPFGLEPYAKTKAGTLSGGYKKRLGIACTATADPDIWLFDEPCANLDIVWRDEVIQMVRELKTAGRGILYVGHDPAEFVTFYDAILFLKQGGGRLIPREEIEPGTEGKLISSLIGGDCV